MKTDFKVLMALMGMEIGGAETHVLELCKSLKSMGVSVYVASNGGAYVKELTEAGIPHFEVPLHNKNPFNLLLSYYELQKIIRNNHIQLVHAHARIPAFLCGKLQKKLHFRFVTTCHGIYSTDLPFKMLSNWGERTLAVSEDIKQYLIENYQLPEKNILVTINGIDTGRFTADTDWSSIQKEFGMDKSKDRIIYVSRLDKGNCAVAYQLLDCIEEVFSLHKKLEVYFVGGGDEYTEIRQRVEGINKRAGRKLIVMTGPRTDVNKFLASADVVVAISRAAMEAMSAERPVILAGNPGYIGVFDEGKLEIAAETNFCCRGCRAVETQDLRNDLLKVLKMKKEEKEALGAYGRQVVLEHYSVQSMSYDAMILYETVLVPEKKIDAVISGYYGSGNHGDDMVLKAIIDDLKTLRPDIRIVVLSKRPKDTEREYGVESIHRMNFFAIRRLFRDTNLLISGGGSLIQDLTSTQSLIYYLWIINSAKKHGARVMLYASGIGPLKKNSNKKRARKALETIDMIALRDEASAEVLKELCVTKPPVQITADAVFSIQNSDENCAAERLEELGLSGKAYFCVAVRRWKYLQDNFEKEIIALCEYIHLKHNLVPLFIPMQPSFDADISKRIAGGIKTGGYYIGSEYTIHEILDIISHAEFVVAMRLHTIVYAAKTGTPVIGLVYDPKVKAMMARFKQEYYCDVENLDGEALRNYADYVIVNKQIISQSLRGMSREAGENAFRNARLAVDLMDKDCF